MFAFGASQRNCDGILGNERGVSAQQFVRIAPPDDRVVVFRFCRGPRDGQVMRSETKALRKDGIDEVALYWLSSSNGELGKQFVVLSPREMDILATDGYEQAFRLSGGPLRKYRYEVVSKQELSSELIVMCEFRGE